MRRAVFIGWMLATMALPSGAAPFIAYGGGDIKVYDMATDEHTNITNDPASDLDPSWSGDGRTIAFVSDRGGGWHMYTMNADGTDIRQRTHEDEGGAEPALSPNGRYIAYSMNTDDGQRARPIGLADLRTGAVTSITSGVGSMDVAASWSSDGERVVYGRRGLGFGIYETRIDGVGEERKIASGYEPAMGPHGRLLAYRQDRPGEPHVRLLNVETGEDRRVPLDLPGGATPIVARWTGDGARLLVAGQHPIDPIQQYLVGIEGGRGERLPVQGYWARWFDPAHPWDASARGKRPFTWGWLKSLSKRP